MGAIGLHLSNQVTDNWELADTKPAGCRQAGIECEDCVTEAAGQLVSISPRMEISQAQALFSRMYPDPACRGMLMPFVVACRQAVRDRDRLAELELPEMAMAAACA